MAAGNGIPSKDDPAYAASKAGSGLGSNTNRPDDNPNTVDYWNRVASGELEDSGRGNGDMGGDC